MRKVNPVQILKIFAPVHPTQVHSLPPTVILRVYPALFTLFNEYFQLVHVLLWLMSHHSKPPSIQRNSLKGFVERGECHMQFMLTNVLIQYFKTTSIATALIPLLTYSIPVVDDSLTSNNENLKKS